MKRRVSLPIKSASEREREGEEGMWRAREEVGLMTTTTTTMQQQQKAKKREAKEKEKKDGKGDARVSMAFFTVAATPFRWRSIR